ncbi:MAG: PD-(D/E)XK nuclease family protein, partial [Bacillota bacterium]
APADDPIARQVIDRLTRTYPHRPFTTLHASMPVTAWTHKDTHTELAKAEPDMNDPSRVLRDFAPSRALPHPPTDSSAPSPTTPGSERSEDPDPRVPSTLPDPRCLLDDQPLSPADRGTAVHLFMEHLDFTRPCTDSDLQDQLNALLQRHLMKPAEAQAVDLSAIRWFLETPLGQQLRSHPESIYRELPLNYALPPDRLIAANSNEPLDQVMIRGRIDLLLADENGFVLMDYKTDDVPKQFIRYRVDSYRPQVDLYREAIEQITGRKVHTTHLIFLTPRVIATV